MSYRISRNFEASLIDFIEAELSSAGWTNTNVEKAFAKVYDTDSKVSVICVRVGNTAHNRAEIGGNSTYRVPNVLIDIFATNDGNRLDLKDFLIDILKSGMPYYEYIITNGQVSNKTQNGRIKVLSIDDTIVNLNVDKNVLDVRDRYRHLLSLQTELGRVET